MRVWSLPERQPALGKGGRGRCARYCAHWGSPRCRLRWLPWKPVAAYIWLPVLTLGVGWSFAVYHMAILRMSYMHLGTRLNAVTIVEKMIRVPGYQAGSNVECDVMKVMKRYRGCCNPQLTVQHVLTEMWCHVMCWKHLGLSEIETGMTTREQVQGAWSEEFVEEAAISLLTCDCWKLRPDNQKTTQQRSSRSMLGVGADGTHWIGERVAEPWATPGTQRTRQNGRLGARRLTVEAVWCVISLPKHLMVPYLKCYRRHGYIWREPT